jgi:hypoxanthine phosphoribosyltransferase
MKHVAANTTKCPEDKEMQNYQEFIDEILIDPATLQARIIEVGAQISQDYQGRNLHMICILRGGVMFLSDLSRHIDIPHTMDFMAVSSYGSERQTTGQVRITLDLKDDIHNRDVLLVEDIVDSGYTIASVLELLKTRHPKSLRVCTLLDKPERREVQVPIDYCGFVIPNKFVFGYGLDMDEYYRSLPFIATVDLKRYKPEN